MRLIILLVFYFNLPGVYANEGDVADAEAIYGQGQAFYENDDFNAAIEKFSEAISKNPDNSTYHHWLAKSYGELAETSLWLKAIRLAENSRDSLLRAVELDPENVDALEDLMKYYQQAPGFLGGSDEKAKEISIQLKVLMDKDSNSIDSSKDSSKINSYEQHG